MRGVVAFDDVLDATLRGFGSEPATGTRVGPAGTAATYGFFFADVAALCGRHAGWTVAPCGSAAAPARDGAIREVPSDASRRRAAAAPASAARPTPSAPPVPARPARRLSAMERFALAELIGLGAPLDERFTTEELRSAFRTLARRYHPDRHTDRSEAEQAELSRMFRRMHAAYRVLASV